MQDTPSAARLGISAVPALVLFRGGRAIGRWTGAIDAKRIVNSTRLALAAADPVAGGTEAVAAPRGRA